ncbi:MAG: F420-dependent methylenetetrahydromethanopterin dehydrogenase [Candidatus Odinarchaeia archaeon]
MVKIGVLKIGNLGISPLFEFLFDERAEREELYFRIFGTGSKMIYENVKENISSLLSWQPDLIVFITPNASLKTPRKIISDLVNSNKPTIIISDAPALKSIDWFKEQKIGFIILTGDPMIGARREFLDPTEVGVFNADIINVLSSIGVFKIVHKLIDSIIQNVYNKKNVDLPQIVLDSDYLLNNISFSNPYAKAKAFAAYKLAELVGEINVNACFKEKEWKKYTLLTTAAHEILNKASELAEEAREMEKMIDKLVREPHDIRGNILKKFRLLEKPK